MFPANFFNLKPGKHNATLTLFMVDVPELTSFSFVRMCQIDGSESTEILAMICL